MPNKSLIVSFSQADPTQVQLLGAKGAKLVEDFQNIPRDFPDAEKSIQLPDGFVLSTELWRFYHDAKDSLTNDIIAMISREMAALEKREGRIFGDRSGKMPLIVAVRGGAPVSLPGAISTVLNVGLNDEVIAAWIKGGEDEAYVLTTYLNAIRMYGEVVLGISYQHFYEILQRFQVIEESFLPVPTLYKLIEAYKEVLKQAKHPRFPPGFETQLALQLRYAVEGVFASWMSPTAVEARRSRKPKVPDSMGTAVTIQKMVFGNRKEDSLSGVLFTRNQRTGASLPVIEWAPRIQCDKIVSGKLPKSLLLHTEDIRERFPDIYENLLLVRDRFERRAKRPLDIEFTVENKKLFILQRRPLRMTFEATVRSLWDMVHEEKTSIQLASMIINKALEQPEKVLSRDFSDYKLLARGEPITDNADSGILAFGSESALEWAEQEKEVILLRKGPYGESDLAVNHPLIRGIIRCDGNATGHEAVSAVAYSKPYLINVVDDEGRLPILMDEEKVLLNPESAISRYIGKRVFVDGEHGIVGYTESEDFLEDRKKRKKLYVDWEYVREEFDATNYHELGYEKLLDLHYEWELVLENYQNLEKQIQKGDSAVSREQLLKAFADYLRFVPERDLENTLRLKDIPPEDFNFGPPLVYHGKDLAAEVLKILHSLMLCITWRTHWVHEIMVVQARSRGDTENDVIRDIFLKNRTMSLVHGFEKEGFHVMKGPNHYYLILASNFEYDQDLDKIHIGPAALDYTEKEALARHFMAYLEKANPGLSQRVQIIRGAPPFGQGHARIVSIGISIPNEDFDVTCRYLKAFLERSHQNDLDKFQTMIPTKDSIELYRLDSHFVPYPEFRITQEASDADEPGDYMLAFGSCSYGEFDGMIYGKNTYEKLMSQVKHFEWYLRVSGHYTPVRPWVFEVDPFRRHSVIAAVGIRFSKNELPDILDALKRFLAEQG